MGIKIINPGMLTTVQDQGRFGYLSSGVATGGALDAFSLALANVLVGNARDAAGLEMTVFGATFSFTAPAVFAITGANLSPKLNGTEVPRYRAVSASAGDTLEFGITAQGCRAYVAFAGGIDVPVAMGSRSTNVACGIGGLSGRALAAGDELAFIGAPIPANLEKRAIDPLPLPSGTTVIRAVLGPQPEYFTKAGITAFFANEYRLTDRSNRMAAVLDGDPVEAIGKTDIVSDAVPAGGVQIPSNGKPIVMLTDRQTTGGYAKIATVASADLSAFAQLKPGDAVRFRKVSLGQAVAARKKQDAYLAKLERRLANHG